MLAPISRVTKELNLEAHQLREWEKRDWLGDVLKDPDNNNQRVYTQEQVERIEFIRDAIAEQREKGFKRTDLQVIEARLLDRFGGEIKKIDTEIMVHPNSMEQIVELIQLQNKKIMELQEIIIQQQQRELPEPVDHSETLSQVQNELKFSAEREEKLLSLVEKLQDDVEKLKEMPPKSRWKFWR